jgi:hypothetical protein
MSSIVQTQSALPGDTRLYREAVAFGDLYAGPIEGKQFTGELSWVNYLNTSDREALRAELAVALLSAARSNQWTEFEDVLYSWKATAGVLSDPELTAGLLAERSIDDEVSLRRP